MNSNHFDQTHPVLLAVRAAKAVGYGNHITIVYYVIDNKYG